MPRVRLDLSDGSSAARNHRLALRGRQSQTADVQVTLDPSPTVSVALTLSATSGTGSAQFASNNSTTLNINHTTTVSIKGITESSTAGNIRLEAKVGSTSLATRDFTVLLVTLSLRNGSDGGVSSDNAGGLDWARVLGTTGLGTFQSSGSGNRIWRTGVEIVGMVTPNNYTGSITIQREVVANRVYNDMTLTSSVGPCGLPTCPDTSDLPQRDDNPQSGGSLGTVYDLDGPGTGTTGSAPLNRIVRVRTNFRQWATVKGSDGTTDVRISVDLTWFSRISIIKTVDGDVLRTDISGDNVAGTGTTNLTWNLQ